MVVVVVDVIIIEEEIEHEETLIEEPISVERVDMSNFANLILQC